jgi:hypothetical protein
MAAVKPVYVRLLIVAIAVYVIAVSLMLSDLYRKVITIEHELAETSILGRGHLTRGH